MGAAGNDVDCCRWCCRRMNEQKNPFIEYEELCVKMLRLNMRIFSSTSSWSCCNPELTIDWMGWKWEGVERAQMRQMKSPRSLLAIALFGEIINANERWIRAFMMLNQQHRTENESEPHFCTLLKFNRCSSRSLQTLCDNVSSCFCFWSSENVWKLPFHPE